MANEHARARQKKDLTLLSTAAQDSRQREGTGDLLSTYPLPRQNTRFESSTLGSKCLTQLVSLTLTWHSIIGPVRLWMRWQHERRGTTAAQQEPKQALGRLELPRLACPPSRASRDGGQGPVCPMTCIRLPRHLTPLGRVVETNWPRTRPASNATTHISPPQTHSARQPARQNIGVENSGHLSLAQPLIDRVSLHPNSPLRAGSWLPGPVPLARVSWVQRRRWGRPPRDNTPLAQRLNKPALGRDRALDHRGLQFSPCRLHRACVTQHNLATTYIANLHEGKTACTTLKLRCCMWQLSMAHGRAGRPCCSAI